MSGRQKVKTERTDECIFANHGPPHGGGVHRARPVLAGGPLATGGPTPAAPTRRGRCGRGAARLRRLPSRGRGWIPAVRAHNGVGKTREKHTEKKKRRRGGRRGTAHTWARPVLAPSGTCPLWPSFSDRKLQRSAKEHTSNILCTKGAGGKGGKESPPHMRCPGTGDRRVWPVCPGPFCQRSQCGGSDGCGAGSSWTVCPRCCVIRKGGILEGGKGGREKQHKTGRPRRNMGAVGAVRSSVMIISLKLQFYLL